MIKEGLVSVVITTYKRELAVLKEAIDSVVAQTYPAIEIILVDDNGAGSEHQINNAKLAAEYGDKVIYKVNEKNSGVQFSRNRGILESQGEFVACLDDDDIWTANKIEEQVKILSKDSSIGLAYCNGYRFFDGNMQDTELYQEYEITGANITFEMMLDMDYVGSTSHPLIRKECFARVGVFDVNMPARQDYEMWLRIAKGGYGIVGTNQALFYYRSHRGERISTNSKKCYIGYSRILKMYRKELRRHRYTKASRIMQLCKHGFKMKKYFKSFGHFMHAFMVSPKSVFDIVGRKMRNR